ncbi:helix-hairpin-helix domain-containing protein [Methanogenium organophilum]|uniref:Protein kinase domain-containing protein n=1 Tax=Methanogenium organophilum TaxID=2199 RepID=A0A9X9T907_METOG|nr:hypothetical protein [Methanogenium organophilum]WAI01677.1 hypothetical protein OU421_02060 [Methanogenium organophilum]
MNILDKRVVYDVSGTAINLSGPLKAGGEGEIFSIDESPGYCAKIFYENRLTATLFQKVTAMVTNPPDAGLIDCREKHGSVVLAWPVSLLFDSPLGSRNFIGYTMPLVDTDLFREAHSYYDPQDRIQEYGGAFSWRYLLTAAYNIATVTDDIHRHGHCVADFSGRNILIARTAAVAVIDCDSFQIRDATSGRVFPSAVGTGEYLPPELQGINFSEVRRDRYHSDLFGLAVMVFKLLMGGVHPFQAGGDGVSAFPGIEQKIQNGVFAFASPNDTIYPPSFAPDYHILPPSVRNLFSRCFVDGIREPKLRPSAGEWKDCLLSEIMAMKHCRVNTNHWFGGHLGVCPWCGRGDADLFPVEVPSRIGNVSIEVKEDATGCMDIPSHDELCQSSAISSPSPVYDVPPPTEAHDTASGLYGGEDTNSGSGNDGGRGPEDTPETPSAPAILLPEPHVTMHNLARNITIPCRLPVSVAGDGPLLIHVAADVPWIEIANTTVPVEGDGVVHVTLNTGNMGSKGFQKGRVMLRAGDIREEIFLFVSVQPEL